MQFVSLEVFTKMFFILGRCLLFPFPPSWAAFLFSSNSFCYFNDESQHQPTTNRELKKSPNDMHTIHEQIYVYISCDVEYCCWSIPGRFSPVAAFFLLVARLSFVFLASLSLSLLFLQCICMFFFVVVLNAFYTNQREYFTILHSVSIFGWRRVYDVYMRNACNKIKNTTPGKCNWNAYFRVNFVVHSVLLFAVFFFFFLPLSHPFRIWAFLFYFGLFYSVQVHCALVEQIFSSPIIVFVPIPFVAYISVLLFRIHSDTIIWK